MSINSNLLERHDSLEPTGREEKWRFTPLKRLGGLHLNATEVRSNTSTIFSGPSEGFSVRVVPASEVSPRSESDDVIVARVRETVQDCTLVEINRDAQVKDPIMLSRKNLGSAEFSRTVIVAKSHSQATIIIESFGSAILGEEIEILLEPGAKLDFISLQEWDNNSIHLGRHHAILGKDSEFNSVTISVGGSLVRLLPSVEYNGPGGSANLLGVYFATSGQHLEHRVFVDHNVGHAKSRVNYKGALAGEDARTVWFGDVYIRKEAEGTDTYEMNRNLLLTDGARADSVPNLEIETGEIIGAGHASTTGRFDEEHLFYLMSRGIAEDDARRLVIRGFFAEVINEIPVEGIRDRLIKRIDDELVRVGR
ncbi:MAG: Fe-S cluster assembly protein SufD [Actinomycetota bacterium]